MIYLNRKRAAIELSMTTIIVVVLSLTLLIFGFIFIRSIMCTAVGITDTLGNKANDEVNRLFGTSGGEIRCVAESGSSISMVPSETNIIYCGIRAPRLQRYRFDIEPNYASSTIPREMVDEWFVSERFDREVSPGDEDEKKIARLRIPDNAPEGDLVFNLDVYIDGQKRFTRTLDYKVTRTGLVRSAIC